MHPLDALALYDTLTPDEQAALDRALAADPALRADAARWQAVRATVRAEVEAAVPDRHLFVLYALGEDDAALLTADEQARVAAVKPALDAAVAAHPGLHTAVRRVWADRLAFEAAWDEFAAFDADDASEVADTSNVAAETPVAEAPRTATIHRLPVDRPAQPSQASRRPALRVVWRMTALAAALGFAVLAVFLVRRDAGYDTIRTADASRLVELRDGSTVELAAHSELLIPKDDALPARLVKLRTGRALFDVERAEERFVVESATARTTVLGTVFTVTADAEQTAVVLFSGAVEVASRLDAGAAVRLAPGQQTQVVGGGAPAAAQPANVAEAMAWTDAFYFRNTPLREVVAQLTQHYDVRVTVDAALADEPITGRFEKSRPVREILDTLARTLDCAVANQPGGGFRLMPWTR